jgi:hypothetical protein
MYARVVRFTEADATGIEANVAAISANPEPEGSRPLGSCSLLTRRTAPLSQSALRDRGGHAGRGRVAE